MESLDDACTMYIDDLLDAGISITDLFDGGLFDLTVPTQLIDLIDLIRDRDLNIFDVLEVDVLGDLIRDGDLELSDLIDILDPDVLDELIRDLGILESCAFSLLSDYTSVGIRDVALLRGCGFTDLMEYPSAGITDVGLLREGGFIENLPGFMAAGITDVGLLRAGGFIDLMEYLLAGITDVGILRAGGFTEFTAYIMNAEYLVDGDGDVGRLRLGAFTDLSDYITNTQDIGLLQAGGFTDLADYVATGIFTNLDYLDNFFVTDVAQEFGIHQNVNSAEAFTRLGVSDIKRDSYNVVFEGTSIFNNTLTPLDSSITSSLWSSTVSPLSLRSRILTMNQRSCLTLSMDAPVSLTFQFSFLSGEHEYAHYFKGRASSSSCISNAILAAGNY